MHLLLDLVTTDGGFQQQSGAATGAGSFSLFWYLVTAIGMWPMLKKAGMPGWGGLIPIYNIYLQIKLAGYSGVLLFLYLVPIVNIVVAVFVAIGNARSFGHGAFYGFFAHFLFQPIGFLITGFGSSRFVGERPWAAA